MGSRDADGEYLLCIPVRVREEKPIKRVLKNVLSESD